MKETDPVRIFLAAEIDRQDLDMANLSRAVGKNQTYIQQFLRRGIPRKLPEEVRQQLAAELKVDEAILGGKPQVRARLKKDPDLDVQNVDEFNAMSAAGGGVAFDEEEKVATWPMPRPYLDEMRMSGGTLAMVPVKGDSMEPTLKSGDRVMIDMGDRNVTQPGIFVIADGNGRVVKRVETIPASSPPLLKLISDNPLHTKYDVLAELVEVIGRVVWVGRRL